MGWKSGRSYSQDLRERVIATVDGGVGAYKAALLFQVVSGATLTSGA
jgi:hypothetical protein